MGDRRGCYAVAGKGGACELYLYDEVGPWSDAVSVKSVMAALEEIDDGDELRVRVNSPGGVVSEGVAIYNLFAGRAGRTVFQVDALAASIMSYIVMSGDAVEMAENAIMMIHSPWTYAAGNAADLRKQADILDTFQDSLVGAYARKSGLDREEVAGLLNAETWYTAAEAVEAGFSDTVSDPHMADTAAAASVFNLDRRGWQNMPAALTRAEVSTPSRKLGLLATRKRRLALLEL